jgi:DNA-binding transcriptional regulator GbsR (MarR family)
MRKPQTAQNALRTPLNEVLGTEANVRLLRVLTLAETPLGAGELASRASLGRTSIYPALRTLERTGIVRFVGAGAQRQVRLRAKHPLARAIKELFVAEGHRMDALVSTLREVCRDLKPHPISVWMEPANSEDQDHESLVLWCLAHPASLTSLTDQMSQQAGDVEERYGVHLDMRGVTRSELALRARNSPGQFKEAILMYGAHPLTLVGPTPKRRSNTPRLHDEHDERSRRLAVAIAAKLKWDPSLVRAAQLHIKDRAAKSSPAERRELHEWLRILTSMSPSRLQRFLLELTERATRLRQSLPALDLLTPVERAAVLASRTDAEVRAAVLGK